MPTPKSLVPFQRLRGKIVERFANLKGFADYLGVSSTTISRKVNKQVTLTREEIEEWANILGIPKDKIGYYFFED